MKPASNVYGDYITAIVLIPVCTFFIFLRFVIRLRSVGLWWDDAFSALSLAFYCVFQGLTIYTYLHGFGKAILHWPIPEIIRVVKAIYAAETVSVACKFAAKMSILFLYERVFVTHESSRTFRNVTRFLLAFETVWVLVTALVFLLQCMPVWRAWELFAPKGSCINMPLWLLIWQVIDGTLDFIVIGLPLVKLRHLQLRRPVKVFLAMTFLLAGLAAVLGFVRMGISFQPGSRRLQRGRTAGRWFNAQLTLSVILPCIPCYNALLTRFASIFGAWCSTMVSSVHSLAAPPTRQVRSMGTESETELAHVADLSGADRSSSGASKASGGGVWVVSETTFEVHRLDTNSLEEGRHSGDGSISTP